MDNWPSGNCPAKCDEGWHKAYFKYNLTFHERERLGYHCRHCDCKVDRETMDKEGYAKEVK